MPTAGRTGCAVPMNMWISWRISSAGYRWMARPIRTGWRWCIPSRPGPMTFPWPLRESHPWSMTSVQGSSWKPITIPNMTMRIFIRNRCTGSIMSCMAGWCLPWTRRQWRPWTSDAFLKRLRRAWILGYAQGQARTKRNFLPPLTGPPDWAGTCMVSLRIRTAATGKCSGPAGRRRQGALPRPAGN